MKKIILLMLLLLSPIAYAGEEISLREQIETKLAKDGGFESAILITPPKLHNLEAFELVEYKYAKMPGKVLITLKDAQGELYTVKAKFDEATAVPAPGLDIVRGQKIEESQLTMVKFPKSREPKNVVTSKEMAVGAVAKKNLAAKKFINTYDIIRPSSITKGKGVKMVYISGKLSIEARGIALEQGSINDFIKVRNADSNKSIIAKILNEDTVVVGGK